MTIKNNPGLKEFLVRLGTTVVAVVLVMYLAKVWFIDQRLAVLSLQRPVSEQVDTSLKAKEEALKPVVKVKEKEIKPVSIPQPPATKVISWKDAAKHYGEHTTVEGTIVQAAISKTGKVCFLNFDPDWKHTFTAVIFSKHFNKFPANLTDYYQGTKVRVTGYIKEYRGKGGKYPPKPEIIVEDPSQIEIVKGKATGPPVTFAPTAQAPTVAAPAAGVAPISSITQASVGQKATLKGTITLVRVFKEAKGRTLKISDGTGTIDVLIWKKLYEQIPQRASLNPGTSLQVSGKIKSYQDKFQIEPGNSSDIQIAAKPVYKKIDTDGDGVPDTFILKGEAKKSPISPSTPEPKIPSNLLKATCTRIADGDTITVALSDGSIKKVRLVGIDTPECWRKEGGRWVSDPEPGGKEASDFTEKEVLGKTVYLDVDDEEPADHYGRTLALVYTNLSDAKKGPRYSLNAKLLQKGLAKVLFIPPSEFDPYSWE